MKLAIKPFLSQIITLLDDLVCKENFIQSNRLTIMSLPYECTSLTVPYWMFDQMTLNIQTKQTGFSKTANKRPSSGSHISRSVSQYRRSVSCVIFDAAHHFRCKRLWTEIRSRVRIFIVWSPMAIWCQRHFKECAFESDTGIFWCVRTICYGVIQRHSFYIRSFVRGFVSAIIIVSVPRSLSNTQCYTKRCVIKSLVFAPPFVSAAASSSSYLYVSLKTYSALQSATTIRNACTITYRQIISLIKLLNRT